MLPIRSLKPFLNLLTIMLARGEWTGRRSGLKKTEGATSNSVPTTTGDAVFIKIAELARSIFDVDGVVIDIRPDHAEAGWPAGASWAFRSDVDLQLARTVLSSLADPVVAAQQGFVAYAGVPVRDRLGNVIGTLAAMAREPRTFDAQALKLLTMSADVVSANLDIRR